VTRAAARGRLRGGRLVAPLTARSAPVNQAPRAAPRSWAGQALGAVVVTTVLVLVSAHIAPGHGVRSLDALGYACLVADGLSMAACWRWPRAATVVVTAVLCVFIARDYPNGPVWLTGWVAVTAVSWRATRRAALLAAAGLLAAISVAAVVYGTAIGVLIPFVFVGWLGLGVLLGEVLRNRQVRLASLAERARVLERSREEVAARRVAEERLRIARDLHDSVAHAMATINVQAGAAAHVLARRPEAAADALTVIQRASGEVLDELSAILRILRQDGTPADRTPTPGIADIGRLIDGTRTSGLDVTLHETGPVANVAPVIGTAAYRVVQEALTNVLRHSRARTVRVAVNAESEGALRVEITDPGPSAHASVRGTGVGLRGMAERVAATGGRLEAGASGAGGFRVAAGWGAAE
jgi:signal transduction histidine kinase